MHSLQRVDVFITASAIEKRLVRHVSPGQSVHHKQHRNQSSPGSVLRRPRPPLIISTRERLQFEVYHGPSGRLNHSSRAGTAGCCYAIAFFRRGGRLLYLCHCETSYGSIPAAGFSDGGCWSPARPSHTDGIFLRSAEFNSHGPNFRYSVLEYICLA